MLQAAEEKYAASQVLSQPEARNEEGLPFTEILEQLDEEDNVICTLIFRLWVHLLTTFVASTISKPGETEPQLMEALRKAGVNELPKASDRVEGSDCQSDKSPKEQAARAEAGNSIQSPTATDHSSVESHQTNGNPPSSSTNDSRKTPKGQQKNVSFAEDTKVDSNHKTIALKSKSPARNTMSSQSLKSNSSGVSKVLGKEIGQMSSMSTAGRKDQAAKEASLTPVIPTEESPEDAVLRRQMIQYNMEEIGAVVAELDLDEEGMSYSDNEDEEEEEEQEEEDYYPSENSSVEEDEDHFGRTRRRVLTDDYMSEMRALEKRLKNVGPNAEIKDLAAVNGQEEKRPSSNANQPNATEKLPKLVPKKGVRFAPSLDVQEATPPPTVNPLTQETDTIPKPTPKPSSNPVLSSIIERPYAPSTDTTTTPPPEPDEYDPALLHQEVATEYHKMRNRMIARQGGFMAQDEEKAEVPLSEAEGGKKKVSRFKAARLGKT